MFGFIAVDFIPLFVLMLLKVVPWSTELSSNSESVGAVLVSVSRP